MIRLRRRPTRSALRGTAIVALSLSAALAAAACGDGPAASEIADPSEIVQAAANQSASATSFHVDVAADGEFSLDLGNGGGGPLSLDGSTATADVDIAGGDARLTFALPGIMGLRGELIAVDGTAWVKTSVTGPMYRELPLGGAIPTDPSASPDTGSMLDALGDFLQQPGIEPVKGEDVECGTTTCYTVEIDLTAAELAALAGDGAELPIPSALPIPLPDLGDFGLAMTIRVEKATNHLAGLTARASAGELGNMTAEVTFSKWNEPVSIAPPPADQVQSGGLFPGTP